MSNVKDGKFLTTEETDAYIRDREIKERISIKSSEKGPEPEGIDYSMSEEVGNKKEKECNKYNDKSKFIGLNIRNNQKDNEMKLENEKMDNMTHKRNEISSGCIQNHTDKKSDSNNDKKINIPIQESKDFKIKNEKNDNKNNDNNTYKNKNNEKIEITSGDNNNQCIIKNKDKNYDISERKPINIIRKVNSKNINKNISNKLNYSKKIFYLILFLNIFLPGIGTIIAAIGWGNTSFQNRTKELIIRGVLQFLTFILLVGWVQAIIDACYYFDTNSY